VRGKSFPLLYFFQNICHYNFRRFQYVVVPVTQNTIAAFFQPGTSLFIVFHLVSMLTTIEFDDQFLFKADEVNNVNSDRMLSPELVRAHLTRAQMFPKKPLCVG